MAQLLDQAERQARRRRLVIIVVVGALLVGGLFTLGLVRHRSLEQNVDSAVSDLRPKWQAVDLVGLADAYSRSGVEQSDSAPARLFPQTEHGTLTGAQFLEPDVVHATYSVEGWGGGSECLVVEANGPTPNRVRLIRGRDC